ncbi:hypothetical protein AAH164_11645, partial [Phocaeicola dorei]|uniref:hypothetical protein n=1 Tax=Phocaeicola dorei TaxID=357276 RepID=UPI0039B62B91
ICGLFFRRVPAGARLKRGALKLEVYCNVNIGVLLYMVQSIYDCSCQWKNQKHCRLSPSCKGWGCRFLSTPIEEIPATIQEKAKLFSKVYREAKQKGVLECPHYRSIFIDEVLANLPKGEVC